jgi:hypothetical protein
LSLEAPGIGLLHVVDEIHERKASRSNGIPVRRGQLDGNTDENVERVAL